MADSTDYPSEVFRLALASGFYHPEQAVRQDFRGLLDAWLDALRTTSPPEDARRVILSEKGTAIEPFILDETDIDCAVFLVRAAFSEEIGATRLRLVGRDTIGRDGGLVLTRSLSSYFVARYPHGKCHGQPKSGWVFAPAVIRQSASIAPAMTTAALLTEDEGFRITISLPECRQDPAGLARQLQIGSRIHGMDQSFDGLGLRIECRAGKIHVLSGSPESMIRCMAHMADRCTMVLQGAGEGSGIPRILIRLELPGEESVPLRAIIGSTPEYLSWFSGRVPAPLSLDESQKNAITRWLRPPKDWLNPNKGISP